MISYNNIAMTGRNIDRHEYETLFDYIKLRVTEKYDFPPEVIQINGITIATLGNFSASIGKPKSKKTFNVSAIVAAALSGNEVLRYKASLPKGRHKVLYIDTEQSRCHCHKVMLRILKLAGMDTDREQDRLIFLMLREYSPKQRRQIINYALESDGEIGLVIIDGCRDLVYDINAPGESTDVINDLLRWSSMYNLHIHTVLHVNKQDDNARGHIGTELNNKAETILQVAKSNFEGNISEVKAMQIRDKEFEPFAFRINEDGLPELVEKYASAQEKKATKDIITYEQHAKALAVVFANGSITGFNVLINAMRSAYAAIGFKRGRNTCIDIYKYLMSQGIIYKEGDGYNYHIETPESEC